MLYLLYSPKQKVVKFHAQKQIGKSHVIDIFTSEDMENISLCIFQYLMHSRLYNNMLYIILMLIIVYKNFYHQTFG
jgi:uncharacterized membrane protein